MILIQCPECRFTDFRFFETRNRYSCNNCGCGFSDQDKEVKKLRIFLSYGHHDNEELVRLIKTDLEKRGHDVWFDKDEIKSGDEWRRSIIEGILGSKRVLSILSIHSTRTDGACRNIIAINIS
jgi:transcription initiation factor TFIIIB Brf1 subunit/transcription initiation factor TFIIB